MNAKKIIFFLATEKGYTVLKDLVNNGYSDNIAAVVSFHEIGMQKDYFDDISQLCSSNKLLFYEWKNIKNNLIDVIKEHDVSGCVAISWRYLLPLSLNDYLEDRIIVFHDSLLPKYRGFAPLVTAMLNCEKKVGVSVLYAEKEADRGDIILQKSFSITKDMYIEEAIQEMAEVYSSAAIELMNHILNNDINAVKQNDTEASYSIWRDEDDYWLDWDWPAERINRAIHCLGYPYKGAKTLNENQVIRIMKSEVVDDVNFEIRTPGKIWLLKDNKPVVVCGEGMLRIIEAVDEQGNEHCFKKLRSRLGGK